MIIEGVKKGKLTPYKNDKLVKTMSKHQFFEKLMLTDRPATEKAVRTHSGTRQLQAKKKLVDKQSAYVEKKYDSVEEEYFSPVRFLP